MILSGALPRRIWGGGGSRPFRIVRRRASTEGSTRCPHKDRCSVCLKVPAMMQVRLMRGPQSNIRKSYIIFVSVSLPWCQGGVYLITIALVSLPWCQRRGRVCLTIIALVSLLRCQGESLFQYYRVGSIIALVSFPDVGGGEYGHLLSLWSPYPDVRRKVCLNIVALVSLPWYQEVRESLFKYYRVGTIISSVSLPWCQGERFCLNMIALELLLLWSPYPDVMRRGCQYIWFYEWVCANLF